MGYLWKDFYIYLTDSFYSYDSSEAHKGVQRDLKSSSSSDVIGLTCIFDVTELSKEEAEKFEQNGPGLASKTFGAIGSGIGAVGGAAKSGIGTVGGVAKTGITGVVGGTVSGIGSVGGKIGGAIGGVFKGGDSEMAEEMANLKK